MIESHLLLASILMQAGRLDEAQPLAEHAADSADLASRDAQVRVANTLKFTGNLASMRGDLASAERQFRRAVEISEDVLGPDDPETAKHLGNLATISILRGDLVLGRTILDRTIRVWEQQDSPHPAYLGGALANLASIDIQEDQVEQGLSRMREAIGIQEAAFGVNSPRLANLLTRYIAMLELTGRSRDAMLVRSRLESINRDRNGQLDDAAVSEPKG